MLTVIVHRRARPRRHTAVLRAIRRAERGILSQAEGRLGAVVFQQLRDPACFLYVGEWTSREAFEAATTAIRLPNVEAHFATEPEVYYCRPLRPLSGPIGRAAVVACALIEGPDAVAEELFVAVVAAGLAPEGIPRGFADYALFQDLDAPGRLFLVHGWLTAADLERVEASRLPLVEAKLGALGATVTRFVACSQVVLAEGPNPD
jgi:quinol monooxygenase YgiN